MSEKNRCQKIFVLYQQNSFRVKFPLSDEEKEVAAKSVMDGLGLFGQMMNKISSVDQVIDDIKKGEESLLNLLLNNDFKGFAAKMFLCEQDKVREYGKEEKEEKKGGGVLNLVEGELYAEYPALLINGSIFYRVDSAASSNNGLDLQKILNKSIIKILAHNGFVCQGCDPMLM